MYALDKVEAPIELPVPYIAAMKSRPSQQEYNREQLTGVALRDFVLERPWFYTIAEEPARTAVLEPEVKSVKRTSRIACSSVTHYSSFPAPLEKISSELHME